MSSSSATAKAKSILEDNPEMMKEIMIKIKSDPEYAKNMYQNFPTVQKILEKNPDLREAFENPGVVEKCFEKIYLENGGEPLSDEEDEKSENDEDDVKEDDEEKPPSKLKSILISAASPFSVMKRLGSAGFKVFLESDAAPSFADAASMMEDPAVAQEVDCMMEDESTMNKAIEDDDELKRLRDENPVAEEMMKEPETCRTLLEPDNLRACGDLDDALNEDFTNSLDAGGDENVLGNNEGTAEGKAPVADEEMGLRDAGVEPEVEGEAELGEGTDWAEEFEDMETEDDDKGQPKGKTPAKNQKSDGQKDRGVEEEKCASGSKWKNFAKAVGGVMVGGVLGGDFGLPDGVNDEDGVGGSNVSNGGESGAVAPQENAAQKATLLSEESDLEAGLEPATEVEGIETEGGLVDEEIVEVDEEVDEVDEEFDEVDEEFDEVDEEVDEVDEEVVEIEEEAEEAEELEEEEEEEDDDDDDDDDDDSSSSDEESTRDDKEKDNEGESKEIDVDVDKNKQSKKDDQARSADASGEEISASGKNKSKLGFLGSAAFAAGAGVLGGMATEMVAVGALGETAGTAVLDVQEAYDEECEDDDSEADKDSDEDKAKRTAHSRDPESVENEAEGKLVDDEDKSKGKRRFKIPGVIKSVGTTVLDVGSGMATEMAAMSVLGETAGTAALDVQEAYEDELSEEEESVDEEKSAMQVESTTKSEAAELGNATGQNSQAETSPSSEEARSMGDEQASVGTDENQGSEGKSKKKRFGRFRIPGAIKNAGTAIFSVGAGMATEMAAVGVLGDTVGAAALDVQEAYEEELEDAKDEEDETSERGDPIKDGSKAADDCSEDLPFRKNESQTNQSDLPDGLLADAGASSNDVVAQSTHDISDQEPAKYEWKMRDKKKQDAILADLDAF